MLAEGATPEIVEERLDAARRRTLTCGDTTVPACYVRNTGAGEVSGIEDGRNREPEL